jgi:internalin A
LFNLSTFNVPHWENLKTLKLLFIANYDLTIPDVGVGFLKHLINLEILTVNGFNLKDFNWLKDLTRLQQLDISLTGISNLDVLENMKQLKRLFISRTPICNLDSLTNLGQLEWLDISETQVEDLRPLKKMIEKGVLVKVSRRTWTGNGIYCEDCPLSNPPREIAEEGNEAILNYWAKQH